MKGWKRLRTADNPTEIGFIRGLLEAEGISTRVQSMELWAAAVEIYFAEGARPSVWVPDGQFHHAERVLDAANQAKTLPPWQCPGCGERHEGQFTVCWRCGETSDDV
ncbi:MAG: putative signal transducing protein [Wenzhouxiangella sp.]